MKHIIISLFILIYIAKISCLSDWSEWKLPEDNRHYHEVTFLTAHNAFSSREEGYLQPQQQWSLEKQLQMGVRGLMLDTYYSSKLSRKKEKDIQLCHCNCTITKLLLRPFKGEPMSFEQSLNIVKNFLIQNPKEIITIFLENYTDANDLDKVIEKSNISNLILKPSDWNVQQNNGWPTLKWMQKKNKRLVLFNQRGQTKYTFDEWTNHAENQFGTLSIKKALNERKESIVAGEKHDRYLLVLNYFPEFYIKPLQTINFQKINSERLNQFLTNYLNNGLGKNKLYKQRFPNFIAVDFVNEGNPMKLVNYLNNLTNDITQRKKKYTKLVRSKTI